MTTDDVKAKNKKLLRIILIVPVAMLAMAYASVPLYDLFCRVTGFGGTTQVAEAFPPEEAVRERQITIRFNADISRDLQWRFAPEQREITVNIGQRGLTAYSAHNPTARPLAGAAIYNVTPLKVGRYFHKVQCFCFEDQTLQPGEQVDMPVMFYVDPALADDPSMDDVTTITLSYTFFKSGTQALEDALEDFYNRPDEAVAPHAEF